MFNSHTLSVLIFSLLFVLGASGILGWIWYEVDKIGEELLTRVELISNQQMTEVKNKKLSEILSSTELKRKALESYILKGEGDTIKLLTRLEALALVAGVSLTTNSLSVEESETTFDDLLLSISIDGNETRVKHFIEILETLPYHGHIEQVQFSREQDGEEISIVDSTVLLRLSISVYD